MKENNKMRAEIIKIGNSKGLRIPKAVLEQCRMKNAVNLMVEDHMLIVTPYEEVRVGWEKGFQLMAKNGDDSLLDTDFIMHSWDEEEWQW
jgi:antitoxin MazE